MQICSMSWHDGYELIQEPANFEILISSRLFEEAKPRFGKKEGE